MKKFTRLVTFLYLVFHISSISLRQSRLIDSQPDYVDNCGKWNLGQCVRCREGYVFTAAGKDKRVHCSLAITGCQTYTSSGSCSACQTGRSLVHNVDASQVCPCPSGTQTFDNGVTCLVANQVQSNCLELSDSTNCKTCPQGYFLDVVKILPNVFGCTLCSRALGRSCSKCYRRVEWASYGTVICQD